MTKPYPTYSECVIAMGRSGRSVEFMQALIDKACDLDLDREREAPAEDRIDWAAYPWARWAIKLENGNVYLLSDKPKWKTDGWIDKAGGGVMLTNRPDAYNATPSGD